MKAWLLKVKNDRRAPAAFFLAGFIFDAFLLHRPDTLLQILHQSLYLVLITFLLAGALLESYAVFQPRPWLRKIWQYHEHITQFLIGTLLNVYTFFYFKSGSLLSSIIFILVLAGLLLANEFVHLKTRQITLKLLLYFLCLFSFWLYVIPMMLGFMGVLAFTLTVIIVNGFIWAFYTLVERRIRTHPEVGVVKAAIQKKILGTGYGVLGIFVIFYVLQVIPPVPLSLNYIGIFHGVKREGGDYVLSYNRPSWKFWQNGDQTFLARPGDNIYAFASVFAPNGFRDELRVRWLVKSSQGWQSADAIPISVYGGRTEGFRGYTAKANYQPGDYRVQVETTDGREIGRINLTVEADTETGEREWSTVRQ